ncbi:MAG TPA: NAD(P)H-binding protein [Steroidobacteraceae bacterium]|nr:NAD(P)H-binding protein [Steroidobacteraceae bacterium]
MRKPFNPLVCLVLIASVALVAAMGKAQGATPLRIVIYGGTGHIGQAIVHEALARGHLVTVVVRHPSEMKERSVRLRVIGGDVLDSAQVAHDVAGADVVVCAVSFRTPTPDFAGYRRAAQSLVTAMRALGARAPRLIVVGGAGSLRNAHGVLVLDTLPHARRGGEILGQKEALDYYRTVTDVPWTYFSPALVIAHGARTGRFRLGSDQLVTDAAGRSRISVEDYAVALIDEAEKPAHVHERFTIGY